MKGHDMKHAEEQAIAEAEIDGELNRQPSSVLIFCWSPRDSAPIRWYWRDRGLADNAVNYHGPFDTSQKASDGADEWEARRAVALMNATDERSLAEAATPGPWVHSGNAGHVKTKCVFLCPLESGDYGQRVADATFISHFGPDRVLEMLTRDGDLVYENAALRREVTDANEELENIRAQSSALSDLSERYKNLLLDLPEPTEGWGDGPERRVDWAVDLQSRVEAGTEELHAALGELEILRKGRIS